MNKHPFIIIFTVALCITNYIYTQVLPSSVGPSPILNYKIAQTMNQNDGDLAVGTRYWAYLSSSPTFQFQKGFLESCTNTNIGSPFTITFPGGLVNKGGTIYTWNQSSPYQIYQIDTTTGVHTLVVSATGVPLGNWTGMTWDGTTMYGVGTSLAASQIFSINMTTGVCTLIGAPSATCAGAISISGVPSLSSLYSVDIVADNLYKWNKTTGVATLIGPLGANANFGQDAQFDWRDTSLYWAAYTTGPGLYKINFNTGSGGQLCTYPAQVTGIAVSEPVLLLPLCEQFTAAIFPPAGWTYQYSGTTYWYRNAVSGFGIGVGSAQWDCWNCPTGTRQTLITQTFTPTTGTASFINLDVAYQPFGTSQDSLIIASSTDNGTTFTSVARLSYLQLGTTSGNPSPFVPTASQWKKLNFSVPSGTNKMLFQGYSGFGDCLYIDSLCFYCPLGINNNGNQTPNNYSLSQNYPNPFNPTTVINFGLPKSGNVKLVVYDVLGREVRTLIDEFKQAGNYNINFSATGGGSELASGIYFYSIKSGDFVETKKMLLIK